MKRSTFRVPNKERAEVSTLRRVLTILVPTMTILLLGALAIIALYNTQEHQNDQNNAATLVRITETSISQTTAAVISAAQRIGTATSTSAEVIGVSNKLDRTLNSEEVTTLIRKSLGLTAGAGPMMGIGEPLPTESKADASEALSTDKGATKVTKNDAQVDNKPKPSTSTTAPEANAFNRTNKLQYINSPIVNVRANAGMSASVLTQVKQGQQVTEIETNKLWSKVRLTDGREGFIYTELLSDKQIMAVADAAASAPPVKAEEVKLHSEVLYVSGSGLRVRSEPNTTSKIMDQLFYGATVNATGYVGGWFQIKLADGSLGYVFGDFLQREPISQAELTGEIIHQDTTVAPNVPSHAPSDPKSGAGVVALAMQRVGMPYVYGACGPNSFDCSGFVQYVYSLAGIRLGRSTYDQVYDGIDVSFAAYDYSTLVPGDILLFAEGSNVFHSGIYIGGGQMVHAGNSSTGVIIDDLNLDYYASRLAYVRRIFY